MLHDEPGWRGRYEIVLVDLGGAELVVWELPWSDPLPETWDGAGTPIRSRRGSRVAPARRPCYALPKNFAAYVTAVGRRPGGEMRGSSVRTARRRIALVAALAAALGVFLSFGAGSASAAATCALEGDTVHISLLGGDTAVVTKGSLNHLDVNGVWCQGNPIVGEIAQVVVHGTGTLVIDQSGGRFTENGNNFWDEIQTGISALQVAARALHSAGRPVLARRA